jgi:hypothetical protein
VIHWISEVGNDFDAPAQKSDHGGIKKMAKKSLQGHWRGLAAWQGDDASHGTACAKPKPIRQERQYHSITLRVNDIFDKKRVTIRALGIAIRKIPRECFSIFHMAFTNFSVQELKSIRKFENCPTNVGHPENGHLLLKR